MNRASGHYICEFSVTTAALHGELLGQGCIWKIFQSLSTFFIYVAILTVPCNSSAHCTSHSTLTRSWTRLVTYEAYYTWIYNYAKVTSVADPRRNLDFHRNIRIIGCLISGTKVSSRASIIMIGPASHSEPLYSEFLELRSSTTFLYYPMAFHPSDKSVCTLESLALLRNILEFEDYLKIHFCEDPASLRR